MKRKVTLETLFLHPVVQKYAGRSGMDHAVRVAEKAYELAVQNGVNPDLAAKAGLLHDIGHYEWYQNGKWDYEMYKENDIHAIKGAARAHKLLVRCGENLQDAKEIALAILLHTDSYLPEGRLKLSPLQKVVVMADEEDENRAENIITGRLTNNPPSRIREWIRVRDIWNLTIWKNKLTISPSPIPSPHKNGQLDDFISSLYFHKADGNINFIKLAYEKFQPKARQYYSTKNLSVSM